jgi:cytochrome P450
MQPKPLPPGPRGNVLTGHLPQWQRDPMGFLSHCAREYGDVVPIRLGPVRFVVLSHPDLVEQVLVTQHARFRKGSSHRLTRSLLGNGLLSSEGEFWRRQRRLVQPAFHRDRIAGYADVMADYTQQILDTWRDGEERDVHAEMMRLTLRIVAKTLFDADITGEASVFGAALSTALERFDGRTSTVVLMLPIALPTPGNLRFRRALKTLDGIVLDLVNRRRASGQDRGDLLSMLLAARDEDGRGMEDGQLRDETITLLFAGHETTALALTWAWYLIAQHPDVEARLHEEVDHVLGTRPPTLTDLAQLTYAEAVVSESLRLYPPAPAVVREAIQQCEIGGYRIPARTSVLMSQWVIQRDARFFEAPEAFRPERWLMTESHAALAQRRPHFAYFPFGGGPRICIGSTFAQTEATLVLASIAQRFRLTLVSGHEVTPHVALTLRPKHSVRVVVERR